MSEIQAIFDLRGSAPTTPPIRALPRGSSQCIRLSPPMRCQGLRSPLWE